jgi:hypothetical protein
MVVSYEHTREQDMKPKAYDPQDGCMYQILCRNQQYNGREWEHCDYAVDRSDKNHLLHNYKLAYGAGWEFKTILLPRQYWPKPEDQTDERPETSGIVNG